MVRKRAVVFRDPGVWNYLDERGEQLRNIVPQEKLQIYRSIFAEVERTAADEAVRRMEMSKPIRVFWSPLGRRFYASRAYKQIKPGIVEITGEKFDVTDDIAEQILKNDLTFTPSKTRGFKCKGCSARVAEKGMYCGECMCEEDGI
jgi:hypothetical protein